MKKSILISLACSSLILSATASARNDFEMFRELAAAEDGNVLFSPQSVRTILALTANGAKGITRDEILDAIGYRDMSLNQANRENLDFLRDLTSLDPSVKILSANALWAPADLKLRCAFKRKASRFYDAETGPLDLDTINAWCDDKTNHLIPKIIDRLNGDERLVLTNALYFKGSWTDHFEKRFTSEETFNCKSGKQSPAATMRRTGYYSFADTGDYAIAELPYGNGAYCMDIILPAEGSTTDAVLNSLDDSSWNAAVSQLASTNLKIRLPRFELEYSSRLNDMLRALGMQKAFEGGNFSVLCKEPLLISSVRQKVHVIVEEEGTEAAAVTAVMMTKASAPVKAREFTVDRPFCFVIRESGSGRILFMGKVEEL